jgi:hypothetical protein
MMLELSMTYLSYTAITGNKRQNLQKPPTVSVQTTVRTDTCTWYDQKRQLLQVTEPGNLSQISSLRTPQKKEKL